MRAEVRAKLAHTFHDRREIYFDGLTHPHSERACLLCIEHGASGADDGFGGHAADIETVSAQERLLDQGNLRSETCCACCGYQPGRPRADDDKIVAGRRGGILPISGVHIGQESRIVRISGFDQDRSRGGTQNPFGVLHSLVAADLLRQCPPGQTRDEYRHCDSGQQPYTVQNPLASRALPVAGYGWVHRIVSKFGRGMTVTLRRRHSLVDAENDLPAGSLALVGDYAAGATQVTLGSSRLEGTLLRQGPITFILTVPVALLVYLASWTGWFATDGGYYRHWVEDGGGSAWGGLLAWVPLDFQNWWHYQAAMYGYHVNEHTPHGYQANPLSWLFLVRPTSMYWHENGNNAETILDLANPLI